VLVGSLAPTTNTAISGVAAQFAEGRARIDPLEVPSLGQTRVDGGECLA
jgi:hypothetical protein